MAEKNNAAREAERERIRRIKEELEIERKKAEVARARVGVARAKEELRRLKEKPPPGKPVEVPVSPPAYTTATGLPAITLGDLGRSVVTAGAGAVVTAVFITSLKGETKWVGAGIGAVVGAIFVATSPIATVPYDLGIGMLSGAAGWMALNVTGKLQR